jgi:hypothetical protein
VSFDLKSKACQRILILGNPSPEHVGAHFLSAARSIGLEARFVDLRKAWSRSKWINRLFYHTSERRPPRLGRFSHEVKQIAGEFKADLLLVTGIAAPSSGALKEIRALGARCVNFLTDDPWNSRNGAGFFWESLREYDTIYSPRRANLGDLQNHGCRKVEYLPFAYNPEVHFPEAPTTASDCEKFGTEVAIVGGADQDRIPLAMALAESGLSLRLYGGYWDRVPKLKPFCRGFVCGGGLRKSVGGALVNICMVRRANRDGHAMRSLELPAMGACMVMEDTVEHRFLFGLEGDAVLYYAGTDEMLRKVRQLKATPALTSRLGQAARCLITGRKHTYADRLSSILEMDR